MLKKMMMVVAMSAVTVCSFAAESDARNEAIKVIEMENGATVYVFKGGKMAVENKLGTAVSTKSGTILKTKDGQSLTMVGNEVARLDFLLKKEQ